MRYRFYKYKNEKTNSMVTVCESHFAGKTVYAKAKCDMSQDTYNPELGENLAKLRVDVKVAEKKMKRAQEKINYWTALLAIAQVELANAKDYYEDADTEYDAAEAFLIEYESALK